jgi:hypothetical protein
MMAKPKEKTEFGDFQTPAELAADVAACVRSTGFIPKSILEPTCGKGNILEAACAAFAEAESALGVEISSSYAEAAQSRLFVPRQGQDIRIVHENFFDADLSAHLARLNDPILVIGNPPWVTNSELGTLGSANLPIKTNFHQLNGFEAKTGKSNFDISEWMLLRIVDLLRERKACLAMLCKTAVARKVLRYIWRKDIDVSLANLHKIDAQAAFGASVDACLLTIIFGRPATHEAAVYESLGDQDALQSFGYKNGELVSCVRSFDLLQHLQSSTKGRWRSGIKHDSSKVMELRREDDLFINGFDESVDLEENFIFPLLKSSDLAKDVVPNPRRWVIVTQKRVGEDTSHIAKKAPKTWAYLCKYAELLDNRRSSIYVNRARFSVFGIGNYSFTSWKVAISGFYKSLSFKVISPYDGKPMMLDDTCNFLSFDSYEEAEYVADLLNSETAQRFLSSRVFWDSKRPITVDLLNSLDIPSLELFLHPGGRHLFQRNNQIRLF